MATAAWCRNTWHLKVEARPAAPVISFVGPDGVGKTTTIGALRNQLLQYTPFVDVEIRHWRPGLLPSLASLFGLAPDVSAGPTATAPRRSVGDFGWFRWLYYGIDFVVGSWLVDRRATAQLVCVLYDRHALDMYVDPARYGLRVSSFARKIRRIFPAPDATVLLSTSGVEAHKRKAELGVLEIERQLSEWQLLAARGEVDCELDSSARTHTLVTQLGAVVAGAMAKLGESTGEYTRQSRAALTDI